MIWRRWGLKDNPYTLNEINEMTLDLFVGRNGEIKCLQNALSGNKRVIFLEGDLGVGKTSLGNFWRYTSMQKRLCFTPYTEISAGPTVSVFSLIMKVIEALNWSLSQNHPFILRDSEFKTHENKSKAFFDSLTGRELDTSFADFEELDLYNAAKELLESFCRIVSKLNYEYGSLIQISFTGLNLSHSKNHTKRLWDLFATEGFRWLLIGEPLLEDLLYRPESKILPEDLYKLAISPLDLTQVHELLLRRKDYLGLNQNAGLPLSEDVIEYLYLLSRGNLKKIFSVCEKIINLPRSHQAMSRLDLGFAKPLITKHFQDEIREKWNLTPQATEILSFLAKEEGVSPGVIADEMKKLRPNVSKILMRLKQTDLVRMQVRGRNRMYYPSMEAKIAFS